MARVRANSSLTDSLTVTATTSWSSRVDDLAAFVITNNHLPKIQNSTAAERSLSKWLDLQRQALRHAAPSLTASRQHQLDQAAPGWSLTLRRPWSVLLTATAEWTVANGRFPSKHSADPVQRLRGQWLSEQRKDRRLARPRFTVGRQADLDRVLCGWDVVAVSPWCGRFDELVAFIAVEGRMPSTSGSPAEAALSVWLSGQRQAARLGRPGFTVERRRLLEPFM
jgi:hypothetical protein